MTEPDTNRSDPAVNEELQAMARVARLSVLEMGKIIRDRIGHLPTEDIRNKGQFDYVTDVDRRCESLIVAAVQKHFPGHAIVSEESFDRPIGEETTWIIDPLDGTTNFIHGFPAVAISVAVSIRRQLVMGLVYDPLRRELFEATRQGGAFLNGAPIRVRSCPQMSQALVATGFPFREKALLTPYLETFGAIFEQVSGIRRAGAAAVDLAHLACGRVDGFWEIGLKPWDVAAGILIIGEAGGRVSDFWGGDRAMTTGHVIAGAPDVFPELLKIVGRHLAPHVNPRA